MSLWSRTPGFNHLFLLILFFLLLGIPAMHAQIFEDPDSPLPGETPTQEIGGAGFFATGFGTNYSYAGALRCRQNVMSNGQFVTRTDAIVGVRIRKGTLVDYMQVICAPLQRDARGGLTWQQANQYYGGSAGNKNGGYMGRFASCPLGYVISGFKAIYSGANDYLEDIRFECSQISGAGTYSSPLGGQKYFQIKTTSQRQWVSWFSDDTAVRSYSLGYNAYAIAKQVPDTINLADKNQLKPQSECSDGGAAALAAGVGTYFSILTGGHKVVQAFQMFCYGGSTDTKQANPYLKPTAN